jgi:hypothetical protein
MWIPAERLDMPYLKLPVPNSGQEDAHMKHTVQVPYILNLGTGCVWGVSSKFAFSNPMRSSFHLLSFDPWIICLLPMTLGSSKIPNVLRIVFSHYRYTNVQNWNSQDCNFTHCQNSPAKYLQLSGDWICLRLQVERKSGELTVMTPLQRGSLHH